MILNIFSSLEILSHQKNDKFIDSCWIIKTIIAGLALLVLLIYFIFIGRDAYLIFKSREYFIKRENFPPKNKLKNYQKLK